MRFLTFRSNSEPDDPDAYWRRRFFILGGGLAVLMVLAWLFGGGGPSPQASRTAAARASVAAEQNRGSLPSAATGQPSPGPSSLSPSPSVSPSPPASPSGSASVSASGGASGGAVGGASGGAPGKGAGAACPPGRVVLTLFTSEPAYPARDQSVFRVYAVSTSQSPCRMKYGPAAVRILVTRHGRKVWDSAACPAAGGARTASLTPGVPQGVTLAWNRKAPGRCGGTAPSGDSGTFQAMAEADGHLSPVRSFVYRSAPAKPAKRGRSSR